MTLLNGPSGPKTLGNHVYRLNAASSKHVVNADQAERKPWILGH